jgi:hypothetical protein
MTTDVSLVSKGSARPPLAGCANAAFPVERTGGAASFVTPLTALL